MSDLESTLQTPISSPGVLAQDEVLAEADGVDSVVGVAAAGVVEDSRGVAHEGAVGIDSEGNWTARVDGILHVLNACFIRAQHQSVLTHSTWFENVLGQGSAVAGIARGGARWGRHGAGPVVLVVGATKVRVALRGRDARRLLNVLVDIVLPSTHAAIVAGGARSSEAAGERSVAAGELAVGLDAETAVQGPQGTEDPAASALALVVDAADHLGALGPALSCIESIRGGGQLAVRGSEVLLESSLLVLSSGHVGGSTHPCLVGLNGLVDHPGLHLGGEAQLRLVDGFGQGLRHDGFLLLELLLHGVQEALLAAALGLLHGRDEALLEGFQFLLGQFLNQTRALCQLVEELGRGLWRLLLGLELGRGALGCVDKLREIGLDDELGPVDLHELLHPGGSSHVHLRRRRRRRRAAAIGGVVGGGPAKADSQQGSGHTSSQTAVASCLRSVVQQSLVLVHLQVVVHRRHCDELQQQEPTRVEGADVRQDGSRLA
mmetsp:Transcript_15999/g.34629  ORF Transcript_15999/g.34629 Transcript_15999/m.34629 type:complete len:490 (+) Transcript_15999:985-2454(+)